MYSLVTLDLHVNDLNAKSKTYIFLNTICHKNRHVKKTYLVNNTGKYRTQKKISDRCEDWICKPAFNSAARNKWITISKQTHAQTVQMMTSTILNSQPVSYTVGDALFYYRATFMFWVESSQKNRFSSCRYWSSNTQKNLIRKSNVSATAEPHSQTCPSHTSLEPDIPLSANYSTITMWMTRTVQFQWHTRL
jgi:hypothetical protein